jgi:hypothetical protein
MSDNNVIPLRPAAPREWDPDDLPSYEWCDTLFDGWFTGIFSSCATLPLFAEAHDCMGELIRREFSSAGLPLSSAAKRLITRLIIGAMLAQFHESIRKPESAA